MLLSVHSHLFLRALSPSHFNMMMMNESHNGKDLKAIKKMLVVVWMQVRHECQLHNCERASGSDPVRCRRPLLPLTHPFKECISGEDCKIKSNYSSAYLKSVAWLLSCQVFWIDL